jgi:transmembrane sensor
MKRSFNSVADLMPGYFAGELSESDRASVDSWRSESHENEKEFLELHHAWDALSELHQMEQYDTFRALSKVHDQIRKKEGGSWLGTLQRVAAVLLVPVLFFSGFMVYKYRHANDFNLSDQVWQTMNTPPGVKAHFVLPDSTGVWLNSSSSISYPTGFNTQNRQVSVTGEVFFDVMNKKDQPFWVSLGKINVRVTGTRFDVMHFEKETTTEVILESGKIDLCTGSFDKPVVLKEMKPGEKGTYSETDNRVMLKNVDPHKYSSWIDGKLIFMDDPMKDVIRRLNRWYNVEIEVADPEILGYVYTATFQNESLEQILELLTISAPIRYQVIQREKKGELYNAKRIILKNRK